MQRSQGFTKLRSVENHTASEVQVFVVLVIKYLYYSFFLLFEFFDALICTRKIISTTTANGI